ncbi:hypothetical protein [Aestuariibacter sp. A3R04]|uniref:hypothetical protein n=1 Tax=Aestuariibacter sp. A3R04 TaxID=2841571 RepID=UPI001C0834E9|nr:hypothetical protein [Aestuariibacter sp. A3R04]MBU3020582.1 hypothetical protein [Aestuariibacter sp. A3R04]
MRFGLLGLWLLLLLPVGVDSDYAASEAKTLVGTDAVEATAIVELADELDDEKDSGDCVVTSQHLATGYTVSPYPDYAYLPREVLSCANGIRAPPTSFLS